VLKIVHLIMKKESAGGPRREGRAGARCNEGRSDRSDPRHVRASWTANPSGVGVPASRQTDRKPRGGAGR